ncbi:hypothetical protein [Seonamhaeicola aphaedonensis]|uniref:PKD domain-containing protein n=1 Tax=Seonamhaeicola aphaedonensis TaxID=1461338 RepID=A0A3D9H836_9FLAO|nr:hypothetical protein [Seonamhaeicola aphaedonensis]RED45639.1 hypothetical protein DFQ02_10817 [Seonamhaeicola aphaedonensis]
MISNKTIIHLFFILAVSFEVKAQETVSDAQLGFNEDYLRKAYSDEGFDQNKIDELIQKKRLAFYKSHLRKLKTSLESTSENESTAIAQKSSLTLAKSSALVANDSCVNMGFEDGTFNGWCRKTGFYDGYSQEGGYIVNYNIGGTCTNDSIFDDAAYNVYDVVVLEADSITIDTISVLSLLDIPNYVYPIDTIPRLELCEDLRFEIVPKILPGNIPNVDEYGIDLSQIQGDYALKIGNDCVRWRDERIEQTFIVSNDNHIFTYNYAVVLEDTGTCGHISFENPENEDIEYQCNESSPPNPAHVIKIHDKPYFTVYLEINGAKIECSEYLIFGDSRVFDFINSGANGRSMFIKQWEENSLDLLKFVNVGDEVTVVAEVGDCGLGGHSGYAYFEASCGNAGGSVQITASDVRTCVGEEIQFNSIGGFGDYFWTVYDNNNGTPLATFFDTDSISYTYNEPGHYRVTYGLPDTGTTGTCVLNESTLFIDVEDCNNPNEACESCDSFSPIPGETYWLGAWVKEEHDDQVMTYSNAVIDLVFSDANNDIINTPVRLTPNGDIIEGWQRIIAEFTIPAQTVYFNLNLINLDDKLPVYFDDVRVHTINGNMKSFVYDPETYRLMAELDENNYSTFYEYDNEGGLVRVKKETVKGVMTIQETRSSNTKTHN